MFRKMIGRYFSWAGLFLSGILICGAIWNWRLLSLAISFTGLLAVAIAVIADNDNQIL